MLDLLTTTALAITVVAGTVVVQALFPIVKQRLTSPLRLLPGPDGGHWFFGNAKVVQEADPSTIQEKWMEQYGPTLSYKDILGLHRLWTIDIAAINHITIKHSYDYQKPEPNRYTLGLILGSGLVTIEGDQHKYQRRALNPAFGPSQVRELTEIFVDKSHILRDRLVSEITKTGVDKARVDVMPWLSKATLDIIGRAGFDYEFNALDDTTNELSQAIHSTLDAGPRERLFSLLQGTFPILRLIRTNWLRRVDGARETFQRIGMRLVSEKKAMVSATSSEKNVARKDLQGRDLLSLLIKANMATDIPEHQRLSDDEILAQVPTFMVAGHETTSTATAWALFALAQYPDVQAKLRDELLSVSTESPSMEELQALPYLDMVVKEVLRHHTPVPAAIRMAMKDDVIPLNTPFVDRNGVVQDAIHIKKGDTILIPMQAVNRWKPYWGQDAAEFRPERWEQPPETISSIPGVFGNILSFLGGPRACIGYRFSLVEMKALLFTLVRSFEFELAVSPERVRKTAAPVLRPIIVGEGKTGQMPLLIKTYVPS
ncbi:cytochrome P450 [Irpex lacteus]|nr:cytochrome P450 [Irpex lacteus]